MIDNEGKHHRVADVLNVMERGSVGDEVFEALAEEQRRRTLRCLSDRQEQITLSELAVEVARSESDEPHVDCVPTDAVERIEIALHHVHLPKLEGVGLVAYDPDRHVVRPQER